MATATIHFPRGQHVYIGKKIDLLFKYTGPDPTPNDIHVFTRALGGSSWNHQYGGDIQAGVDPRSGVALSLPVGNDPGTFDLRIDWTWKPERREIGSDQGQYFVDVPPPTRPPSDPPDEEEKESTWWKWLLLPLTGPLEVALLVIYLPFWGLDLLGFGNPLQGALKRILKAIRDNLLPSPFSGWGT